MNSVVWLIPFFPLAGFLINGLAGKRLDERFSGLVGSSAVALSFITGLFLFGQYLITEEPLRQSLFSWLAVGGLHISVSYVLDSLSFVMVLVITGVGFLIHVYSIGYMKGDRGIQRYFAFLNLFTFMMLTLVMADNFLLLFLGWEGVGLCSYLLIGFWYEDPEKAAAGKKAFIVNRVGDFGFLLAMFLILSRVGSLQFSDVLAGEQIGRIPPSVITGITLLLLLGAVGKSAQIPLYVWLPDAMAGPTPVSALIHAATMVTAGVYLIARCGALFAASPTAMAVVSAVGILTAFFAATMAITENDIKKVLAYSTISQLGYMFAAVGVGAFAAGIFHLVTHAFFKALLFLAAGSVIHGMGGIQDMRRMGGLKGVMPKTYWSMLVGVGAISGVPLLSGFFSKDEILWNVYSSPLGGDFLTMAGVFTAAITAFYMFRLFFMTFHGERRWDTGVTPHDAPSVMTVPVMVLAFLALIGGYTGVPESLGGGNIFHHFIQLSSPDSVGMGGRLVPGSFLSENVLMVFSVLAAVVGFGLAFQLCLRQPGITEKVSRKLPGVYAVLSRKYFVDEIYDALFVQLLRKGSEVVWRAFDLGVIDRIVNGSGKWVLALGGRLRRVQTGVVQNYAAVFLLGVILIVFYVYLR